MLRRLFAGPTLAAVLAGPIAAPIAADPARAPEAAPELIETSAGTLAVSRIVSGLNEPWAVGFLPDGALLITERAGRLWHVPPEAEPVPVAGLPEIAVGGQGGLLDLIVPGDFAETREILFTYSIRQGRGAGTALATARLAGEGDRLEDVRVLFQSAPGFSGGRHFGSRIAEGPDGMIYVTIGDRGSADSAQDRGNHNGTVVRLHRDGRVPDDNPYVGEDGIQPEIWSWGHRNAQGMAFGPDGRLWSHEHGARGGDEINLIRPDVNYGWPVIAYGRHYSGGRIGIGTEAPGMAQPQLYWDPSIAPSGLAVHDGSQWPDWRGSLFVGSLQFHMIARIDPAAGFSQEVLQTPSMRRVRDVRAAPDGTIWFLSVGEGALFRMAPAG